MQTISNCLKCKEFLDCIRILQDDELTFPEDCHDFELNTELTVYTTEVCPKCQRLKTFLQAQGIPFKTFDMQSPEGLAELRFNGCFALEAPVLQIGEEFYTTSQIFQGTELSDTIIQRLNTL